MDEATQEFLFMKLIFQVQQLGFMGLGKLKNPVSLQAEINISQVKLCIEMLEMIKLKTKGNLSEKEGHYLDEVIREMKISFVSISKTA